LSEANLSEANQLSLNAQLPAAVQGILQDAIAQGFGEDDYSALFAALH
jgi:3-hydroxyisobutyrate dehydrogenase-like beta-hydroxyacid dehydrogenase